LNQTKITGGKEMSKGLLLCFKQKSKLQFSSFFEDLTQRIKPDNLSTCESYIHHDDDNKVFSYIYNPILSKEPQGSSFLLGFANDTTDNLFEPLSACPDGTFALFRANKNYVEILSDFTASRTIWFYYDEDFFIASTSQRIIISFLGNFSPNTKAISWMLCSGTLGPGEAWDKRLQYLPANSRIILDRKSWNVKFDLGSGYVFQPAQQTKKQHKSTLKDSVKQSVQSINYINTKCTLALSGGMDSRSILYYLKDSSKIDTITWGLKSSMNELDSDAALSKQLAQHCNLSHEYVETDFQTNSLPTILNRFLVAGEGRIDHLSGYMDGLALWSKLSLKKRIVIRGYDALGRKPPVANSYQARRVSGLILTEDYSSSVIPEIYYLSERDLPKNLSRRTHESLEDWRDRLWLEVRTPFVTAALDDIKSAYVEVVNPLLCKRVVEAVLDLPIELRTNKKLFSEIVSEMFLGIPFAKKSSVQMVNSILDSKNSRIFLRKSLYQAKGKGILQDDFLDQIIKRLDKKIFRHAIFRWLDFFVKATFPSFLENAIRTKVQEGSLNVRRLALRAIIIIKMHEILLEDAEVGRKVMHHVVSE
jgi:asparagine synthetase B (glutamine-hydrolysing)